MKQMIIDQNEMLLDDFNINGNDYNLFENILRKLDEITTVVTIKPADIALIHCEHVTDVNGNEGFRLVNLPSSISDLSYVNLVKSIKTCEVSNNYLAKGVGSEDLINELNTVKVMLLNQGTKKNMLLSRFTIPLLTRHLDITSAYSEPTVARDIYIASKLKEKKDSFKFVVRKSSTGAKKVFGIFSDRYQRTPYSILLKAIQRISNIKVFKWTITNQMVEIYFGTNKKFNYNETTYYPGYHFCTSDSGAVGFKIEACVRIKKGNQDKIVILDDEKTSIRHICAQDNSEYIDCGELIERAENQINLFLSKVELLKNETIPYDKNKDIESRKTYLLNYAKRNELDKAIGLKHIKAAINNLDKIEIANQLDVITVICMLDFTCNSWSTERKVKKAKGQMFI